MQHKGNPHATQLGYAFRRQSIYLCARHIHHEHNLGECQRVGRQNSDAARLDLTGNRNRGRGDKRTAFRPQIRAIIRYKPRPERHQVQRQRRFPCTRRPDQQNAPLSIQCHDCAVNILREGTATHTGSPTTKRAPKGSEVISASVGRIFSAQITPPCASTICLEIARPRPE